ncbi:AlpA family phage regulatory protein [Roseobacter sp. N2S]|uniref:helix-turn-helix transcriptional regulator n=1 Tax=Roseobacter sp. N2S TaxID=2663844 RepID=UPI0028657083|nr:AlpA family phage regulatory protein [Roseobacter sp. N2S]MDR6266565.1 putative DNA-binding transcriptional regulator AlpA [Roseobacter sp. N2S]
MAKIFMTTAEVADLLEYGSTAQFSTRREDLIRDHGFPRPVPVSTRPMKWRRADVEQWMAFAGKNLPNGQPPRNGMQARNVLMFQEARS